jgi:hypothetical protein
MYLTINQVSDRLEKTPRQIYYMVKSNQLNPINFDSYRRDGGYKFSAAEVEEVEKHLKNRGLSLNKASSLIGISLQYLNSLALKGEINSKIYLDGKKKTRYFTKEDCMTLKKKISTEELHRNTFGKKIKLFYDGYRLFGLVEGERIINPHPLVTMKENGDVTEKHSLMKGEMFKDWPKKKYSRTKGFIQFQFTLPRHPQHPIFEVFYDLFSAAGPKNIKVFQTNVHDFIVICRELTLVLSDAQHQLIARYLVDGELDKSEGKTVLKPVSKEVVIKLTDKNQKKLTAIREDQNLSSDEVINMLLEKYHR